MAHQRFYALDALRGLAIALMILVNTPGSWSHVYAPLLHAPWHGFTFADMVFPGFLFVVGAAMFYALRNACFSAATLQKIARRTTILFLLGLLLHAFPFTGSVSELRLMGVLQRIALCYGIAALLVILIPAKRLLFSAAVILLLYHCILVLGSQGDPYSLADNAVRRLDLWLFGSGHLYQGFGIAFDPEGLLSTIPAVVSVLIGYYVALQLSLRTNYVRVIWLVKMAAVLLALAAISSYFWPVNKALWTASYVLLSSGLLVLLLAILVWFIDIRQQQQWAQPLIIYGTNPLFIYVLAWIWAVGLSLVPVAGDSNLYQYSFSILATLLPAKLASLLFALLHVMLFWLVSLWLYRRHIIIRL